MTTAHRPTWAPAVGKSDDGGWSSGGQISKQFSARDLPGHTKLKIRQPGQGTEDEINRRNLRLELEERERENEEKQAKDSIKANQKLLRQNQHLLLKNDVEDDSRVATLTSVASKYDDADDVDEAESSESDSESEDDEADLLRELEKIKQEREEERLKKEQETREANARQFHSEALIGNPLLETGRTGVPTSGTAAIKRKWNDDVVFKNQARDVSEPPKRFINDTVRNDFHRKFLSKYMQ